MLRVVASNLVQNISLLRKALGDDSHEPQYIETLPKRGYRFIAEVREEEAPSKSRRTVLVAGAVAATVMAAAALWWVWQSRQNPGVRSLAVLPLKPLPGGPDDDQLGWGIADGVIGRLGQVGGLTVRPISAVRKYSGGERDALEAARALKVDSVLDGTIQRSGDRLRVSVNLLRTRDGASLWAEIFDVPFTDLFAVQDEVSRQVVSRLRLNLTAAEQARLGRRDTSSPKAYECYLKAVRVLDRQWAPQPGKPLGGSGARADLDVAMGLFQKAVEMDPNYALARAQLANAYVFMLTEVGPENRPGWSGPGNN